MQKAAHVVALIIAYVVWQAIGGIPGLIVAVLAVGLIEIVALAIFCAISAPFSSDSSAQDQNHDLNSILEIGSAEDTRPRDEHSDLTNSSGEENAIGKVVLRIALVSIAAGIAAAAISWVNMDYTSSVTPAGGSFINVSLTPCRGWPLQWYFGSASWYGWKGFRFGPFAADAAIFAGGVALLLGIGTALWIRTRRTAIHQFSDTASPDGTTCAPVADEPSIRQEEDDEVLRRSGRE